MQSTTTVRLDPDTLGKLDKLAQELGRPRSWVIKEAVARYLDDETWFVQKVQEGLDDVEAGRVVSHENVKQRLRARGIHVD